jgi:2-methylisocitrate lyase-like PEP mutase family enzyme
MIVKIPLGEPISNFGFRARIVAIRPDSRKVPVDIDTDRSVSVIAQITTRMNRMPTPNFDNATRLAELHGGLEVLTLPNVWDAGSAIMAAAAGASALATTSAGVAWARGHADGGSLPVEVLRAAAAEIVRVSHVPVSVDIEDGYSQYPACVAELVEDLWTMGVSGVNIEDGIAAPEAFAEKIRQIRHRLTADRPLFINARTDVYLRGLAAGDKVAEVLRRAALYREGGASGLFVPGLTKDDEIEAIAKGAGLPLNVMALPGLPDRARLAELGVRRLSAGSAIAQASLELVRRAATEFLEDGGSSALFAHPSATYQALSEAAHAAAPSAVS